MPLDTEVPYLLLQPIVENALKHGIGSMTTTGRIEIIAKKKGAFLELAVIDNGPGLSTGTTPTKGNGIRLRQLYGDQQSILIDSSPDSGTIVQVRFPFKTVS